MKTTLPGATVDWSTASAASAGVAGTTATAATASAIANRETRRLTRMVPLRLLVGGDDTKPGAAVAREKFVRAGRVSACGQPPVSPAAAREPRFKIARHSPGNEPDGTRRARSCFAR